MSKSFRARQLDSNKPLPVYRAEELPDLTELSAINRAVPQMPTGMEKEEETVSKNKLSTRSIMLISFRGDDVQVTFKKLFSLPNRNIGLGKLMMF